MSDYVRHKVIRCKITKEDFDKYSRLDTEDYYDKRETFAKNFNINEYSFDIDNFPAFSIECDYKDNFYIDYNLFYEYGSCAGDVEFVRPLTEKENEKYMKIFRDKFGDKIQINELRYVDYCYYNGVDAPNVWEFEEV